MASSRDKNGRPVVVVTGMGVVTSLGAGKADNWAKLTAGESGIRRITRFPTDGLKTTIAGTVDFLPVEPFCSTELGERMAGMVAEEAIGEAGIGRRGDFPGPLFLAVAPVEFEWPHRETLAAASGANDAVGYDDLLRASASGRFHAIHERCLFGSVAEHLADRFGTKGSPISVSTACASGASAIQLGVEAIRRGETDAALCIGTDGSVNPEALIRFSLLSALSTANDPPQAAAKPFSKNRDGFVMAEGAAALVLESQRIRQGARRQNPRRLGGLRRDGGFVPPHPLEPRRQADHRLHPQRHRGRRAHAPTTSTTSTRTAPARPRTTRWNISASPSVFGERAKSIPISSNKSMVGHTLSAAGAVEAVFTLLTLEHQRLPPTINYNVPDPAIPLDVVPNAARDAKMRHALSNSFGFGGQNVSLVMSREPA